MIADYLSSLGLVLGMIAAWLLYRSLPPAIGAEKPEQRYRTNAGRGFLVLFVAFLLQLAAIWIPF